MSTATTDEATGLGTKDESELTDEERKAFESVGLGEGGDAGQEGETPDERLARQQAEQAERLGTDGPPAPPVDDVLVAGTQQALFDVGGKQPTSATVTLTGGKFDLLEGQGYKKGDVVTFVGTAVVHEVSVKDTHDPKTGMVVSAAQGHKARITDLTIKAAS